MIRPGSLATPISGRTWGGLRLRVGKRSIHTIIGPAVAGYEGCRPDQARAVNDTFRIGDTIHMNPNQLKLLGGFGSWYRRTV